jgi:hypothetical protein
MAWTNSKVFRQWIADIVNNDTAMDYLADTVKIALYGNGITPDNDVTAANSAYNVGQWVTGGEITSSTDWPAGGQTLGSKTTSVAVADLVTIDAADAASGNNATLISVYGGLVYDDTIATPVSKQGFCYLYFGGTQSITAGTMTVVFNTAGLMSFTL